MAEFSGNLDNGELYLPHDLFSLQNPTMINKESAVIGPEFPCERMPVEDLEEPVAAQAALSRSILPQHAPKPRPNAAQFRPVYRPEKGFPLGGYYPTAFGRSVAGFGSAVLRPGPRPVHPPYPSKPHPAQPEGSVRASLQKPNPARDRFGIGPGPKRGTGFFLPRVIGDSDAGRRQNKGDEGQAPPMRNAGKQARAGQIPSAGLPKDWTY